MGRSERIALLRRRMAETRAKTLLLLGLVPDAWFNVRVHDFYSPIGWHFGHVAATEEHWVCVQALRRPPRDAQLAFLFANLPENPKDNRVHVPPGDSVREYMAATRCAALQVLETADVSSTEPLLADAYAWWFAVEHECQHQETICELLQLIRMRTDQPGGGATAIEPAPPSAHMVSVPGGRFMMGSDELQGYDNERSAHWVEVAPFELDRSPVTASQWLAFRLAGYDDPRSWTEAGWQWRLLRRRTEAREAGPPEYWSGSPGDEYYAGPLGWRAIHPLEPVSSVSWYEADAYARWAGKRLPTEEEWEYAAAFDPAADCSRRYPWGDCEPRPEHACFGVTCWRAAPVGGRPEGASALGLLDMAGGVWEWTATPFMPYPGFEAFPYDGYSKDQFTGEHYVCRGGSWATAGPLLRCSFRNWYVPGYRQGILGLRCAR